jgi:hypothetical protein
LELRLHGLLVNIAKGAFGVGKRNTHENCFNGYEFNYASCKIVFNST